MFSERFEQWLVATLADKEREKLRLDGEVSALQFVLTTFRQFAKQKEDSR